MTKLLPRFGNRCVILLLRSPFHRLASGTLVLVGYRGRRSGRRFTVPVMYAEADGDLTVFVGHAERKSWWRNLRGGAEVEVRLRGRRQLGHATATGAEAAAPYLERYPRARAAAGSPSAIFVRISALRPAPR